MAGLDIVIEHLRSLGTEYPDRIHHYECDVTSDRDVEQAVDDIIDQWSKIDVLVNNAAIFNYGFLEDRSLDDTRQAYEANYFGYLRTIWAVLPHMLAQDAGIIYADRTMKIGLSLAKRFPAIVRRGTQRVLEERDVTVGRA